MFSQAKAKYLKEGTYRGRVAVELADAFASHTPEAAYWAGWLNANTTIVRAKLPNARTKDFAIITTLESEREHLLRCLSFLGTSDAVSKPTERGTITHKSGVLVPILANQGIVYGKTNVSVPKWCVSSKDFWRGYVDANGEADINNENVLYLDIQCPETVKLSLHNYILTLTAKSTIAIGNNLELYNNGIVVYGTEAIDFFTHLTTDVINGETIILDPKSVSFNHAFNDSADMFAPIESTEQEVQQVVSH